MDAKRRKTLGEVLSSRGRSSCGLMPASSWWPRRRSRVASWRRSSGSLRRSWRAAIGARSL